MLSILAGQTKKRLTMDSDFGGFLSNQRKNKNLEVRALAIRTGIDKSTISRVENNKTETTISTLIALCIGLEIELNELVEALLGIKVKFPERNKEFGVLSGKPF
jgi:transcriptional regulator with XRE-family HTH domain